jgi:hypothetical protein
MPVIEGERRQAQEEAGIHVTEPPPKSKARPKGRPKEEKRKLSPEAETVKDGFKAVGNFAEQLNDPPLKSVASKEMKRLLIWGPFFIALGVTCVAVAVKLVKR